jgi:predicted transcriptional regulator
VAEIPPPPQGAELEVLKALWEHGPGTVREVNDALRGQGHSWAYTTVQTMLNRLEAKGYARCDRARPAHVFAAALSREDLLSRHLRDLADQLCDGVASPLLQALVEGGRFTSADVAHLRRLINRLDPPKKR